jgi:DNA-binding transcriptional regulator WhiA
MEKEKLQEIYNQFKSVRKTAEFFGCSYGKIRYQLDKHNIEYIPERHTSKVDIKELQKIYEQTQSAKKVGEHFGMSKEKAIYILKRENLINELVRYSCDQNFFEENNEKSFYWAGFIASDGSIIDRRKTLELSIGLSKKDKSLLEKFKKDLKAENPIHDILVKNSKRNKNWNDSWKSEIKLTSNKLCKNLERFNIVPRKTKTYTFPKWLINHDLVNHFMRGYFDGDGSFFTNNQKKTPQLYFSLRGTSEFLKAYREVLEKTCDLPIRIKDIRINNGIGVLEYGGNNIVPKIAEFLYKNSTVCLERKRDLANNLSSH